MSTTEDDETIKSLSERFVEERRLKTLSDIDLIRECMKSGAVDDPKVEELMNRLRPGWLDEL
jgi:hypothetical protein